VRASTALMAAGLTALAVFALAAQQGVVDKARAADKSNDLAGIYQDARFWVSQNESLERKFRVEPSPTVLEQHQQAGRNLIADLRRVAKLEGSPANRRVIARLLAAHTRYETATLRMFASTSTGNPKLATYLDIHFTDPVFNVLEMAVYGSAIASSREALRQGDRLITAESEAFYTGLIAITLAVCLVGGMGLILRRYRRMRRSMLAAEITRLSEMVITDPLTGLRNHRAFHEDLEVQWHLAASATEPLALVLLDVDKLKATNDTHGHQAGDDQLRALGEAIMSSKGERDLAYRIGGDKFAVVLPALSEWGAFELAQRLHAALVHRDGLRLRARAGISQALELRTKDTLIRDADRALLSAKRSGQAIVLFTPEMEQLAQSALIEENERHTRTLASALALAVDAKDSYTQSHSETVSNLCAAIGDELGLAPDRIRLLRIGGLLHDVGKIGIPDAILRKPAKLTAEEFELMKTHTILGENIILAAEMPKRASWVRHHHEHINGCGYPDGLAGEEIPIEARVIHVADAFEAMISDRPYRKAPGQKFAIEELCRHCDTQFDRDVVEALLRVLGSEATLSGDFDRRTDRDDRPQPADVRVAHADAPV
jgi:diguanylate cyclase (GGDEF)-like protein